MKKQTKRLKTHEISPILLKKNDSLFEKMVFKVKHALRIKKETLKIKGIDMALIPKTANSPPNIRSMLLKKLILEINF